MPGTEISSGKKRLRASQACLYCRSKRSKCDGSPNKRPCTQCKDKDTACEFVQGKRNRRYLEDHAAALQEQNQTLQRALAQARRTSISNGSTWETNSAVPLESEQRDAASGVASFAEFGIPEAFDENNVLWEAELTFDRLQSETVVAQGKQRGSSDPSSALYGSSPNGQAFPSRGSDVPYLTPSKVAQSQRNETTQGDHITDAAKYFLTNSLSKSAIDYLVGLFFTRCMVMMKYVPPGQFLANEYTDTPNRQPSSLLLAILAAALRYATRTDVLSVCFDKDGNNVPAALAKKLLETELVNANIDTVHALLAISEVETSSNNLMSGYMYGSMAVRLLFNLRLHYGSGAETLLSPEDALARYWLLWNLSVQDHTWSIELRCPPSIHPSRLRTARELFESRGKSPHEVPEAEIFEVSVGKWILNLMVISREITLELYSAPPKNRAALVPKLDAKLRSWLQDVPDEVLQNPIGRPASYHFHFGFHMMMHSTWLLLHRELAYLETDDPQITRQVQLSSEVIAKSATQMAKLFETFRRTDDARFFHASGVQWIGLAVDGLSRYLDRIPVDQAIEPLAHLQSLQRTLKVLADYFAQAASLYKSTAVKTQEVLLRMEDGISPIVSFQVSPLPRSISGGPFGHIYATISQQVPWKGNRAQEATFSDQTTDVASTSGGSQHPEICPPDWLSHFSEEDMVMAATASASSLTGHTVAQYGHV